MAARVARGTPPDATTTRATTTRATTTRATTTRERILAIAAELFGEQGYDATSLREIAARLGFTKAALYYHFRSKEEILVALLEPGNELLTTFLDRLERAGDVRGWADALTWIIDHMHEHLEMLKVVQRNRAAVESLPGTLPALRDHRHMHERVERAAHVNSRSLEEEIRMLAAIGAVTGFDDWGPDVLLTAPRDVIRAELAAAVHDILGLRGRGRAHTRAGSRRASTTTSTSDAGPRARRRR